MSENTNHTPANRPRPLSPHLQVYRPQITSVMSIFHRFTGIGLALGLPVLVVWLLAAAYGQESFALVNSYLASPLGMVLLSGWIWAFYYHLCTGIRHLFWDAGYFLEIKQVYATGRIALGVSTLLTLITWAMVWGLITWGAA